MSAAAAGAARPAASTGTARALDLPEVRKQGIQASKGRGLCYVQGGPQVYGLWHSLHAPYTVWAEVVFIQLGILITAAGIVIFVLPFVAPRLAAALILTPWFLTKASCPGLTLAWLICLVIGIILTVFGLGSIIYAIRYIRRQDKPITSDTTIPRLPRFPKPNRL